MTMPDDNDDQPSTQNEETTFDGSTHSKLTSNQAELKSLTQVIDLSLFQADPYRPELDNSAFDVTRYLPPGVQVQFVERGGALFIPHRINEFAVKIVKRRVDLVCFQCCLRFTLGFNRPAAKLSHGFMARWTGLMPQNVRRGLLSLKEMGLIRVLVSPTNSTSTIYEVPIVRGYLDWKRQREDEARGSNQSEYTQRDGVYLNQLPPDNQLNYPGIISPITKKENSNKNTNLSLSDESLPHKIKAYIAGLKPHRKRVEEEYHLQQLMVDYPVDDIVESLDFVQTHGTLDTGEAVFMPFKYLCFAAEDVIAQIAKEKARIARAEELRVRLEQEQAEEEHRRTQDAKEMNDALAAFAALDAEERNRHVAQFRQTHYGSHGMEPPESITLNLAAKHWYQRKREQL